jgi:hypothetical protein
MSGLSEILPSLSTPVTLCKFVRDFKPLMQADWDLEGGAFPFHLVGQPVHPLKKNHLWEVDVNNGLIVIYSRCESPERPNRVRQPWVCGTAQMDSLHRNRSVDRLKTAHDPRSNRRYLMERLIWTQVSHGGRHYVVKIPVDSPIVFHLRSTRQPWGSTWHWDLTT